MKKLIFIICLSISIHCYAQDKIMLQNGDTLSSEVVELSKKHIKIKENNCLIKLSSKTIKDVQFEDQKITNYYRSVYPKTFNRWILALQPCYSPDYPGSLYTGKIGYIISPNIELNAHLSFSYLSAGANFYFLSREKHDFSPFIGYQIGYLESDLGTCLPLGLNYQFNNGIEAALLAGILKRWRNFENDTYQSGFIGFSVGWSFY